MDARQIKTMDASGVGVAEHLIDLQRQLGSDPLAFVKGWIVIVPPNLHIEVLTHPMPQNVTVFEDKGLHSDNQVKMRP